MSKSKLLKFAPFLLLFLAGCGQEKESKAPFRWDAANIYFLLTDRFNNGNPANDVNFDRSKQVDTLRGFMGGDIIGITQKIKEGYFNDLGINAIWFSPVFEQIKGYVDEGHGDTYGFHGYWIRDWTSLDPNFGTLEDLEEMIEVAHQNGIRILMDVVINHIGPVTPSDEVWPAEWVRTSPACGFTTYENTIFCTLTKNLPDIKTDSNEPVELPEYLVNKWKAEGRYEKEVKELDEFFERTGHPRAPRFYIIKWLTDYVKRMGIDGYRFDTVKHLEESIFDEVKQEAQFAFDIWKKNNPGKVLDNNKFFMVGEVYGYAISNLRNFHFEDRAVDYFTSGFESLINFEFPFNAMDNGYEAIFSRYDSLLNTDELKDVGILNYLTSHDDPNSFDKERERPIESANKLLLSPGSSQVYYGDEIARPLEVKEASGDASLRSFMNWNDLESNKVVSGVATKDILTHWQKLGQFRNNHPAIGAGRHKMISQEPYVFSRTLQTEDFSETVVVGLEIEGEKKEINVTGIFEDGVTVRDAYSNQKVKVKNGVVAFNSQYNTVLLEKL
jgi:alpha-amylase